MKTFYNIKTYGKMKKKKINEKKKNFTYSQNSRSIVILLLITLYFICRKPVDRYSPLSFLQEDCLAGHCSSLSKNFIQKTGMINIDQLIYKAFVYQHSQPLWIELFQPFAPLVNIHESQKNIYTTSMHQEPFRARSNAVGLRRELYVTF